MASVLQTELLTKSFGSFTALDKISIEVNEGEIYGFLGLNGAGKTTLIKLLLGMVKPSNGNIKLLGETLTQRFTGWSDIGYLVETPHAYPDLTVTQNLQIYSRLRTLRGNSVVSDIIEQLQLSNYRDKKAKHLSLGNLQRLGLAKALIHQPKLLILDEPINGLDPAGIVEIRKLLLNLSKKEQQSSYPATF
jgi:ABC-2 type transport system ATP-binding protein